MSPWVEDTGPTEEDAGKKNSSSPFEFFSLPFELRLRIYELCLVLPDTIDLKPSNRKDISPRLGMLRTSRQMYQEAYPVFYSKNTFQIFPTHPAHLYAKPRQLLPKRVPKKYREQMTSLQLCFGPGWGSPPKCQVVKPNLGLTDCTSARLLKIFVQCDPSQDVFKNFRFSETFYTTFCTGLMRDVLENVPSIKVVEIDAYPSVKKSDALIQELISETEDSRRIISWGPARQWDEDDDSEDENQSEEYELSYEIAS